MEEKDSREMCLRAGVCEKCVELSHRVRSIKDEQVSTVGGGVCEVVTE